MRMRIRRDPSHYIYIYLYTVRGLRWVQLINYVLYCGITGWLRRYILRALRGLHEGWVTVCFSNMRFSPSCSLTYFSIFFLLLISFSLPLYVLCAHFLLPISILYHSLQPYIEPLNSNVLSDRSRFVVRREFRSSFHHYCHHHHHRFSTITRMYERFRSDYSRLLFTPDEL